MKLLITGAARLACLFSCPTIILLFISVSTCVATVDVPELHPEDCVKCHPFQLKIIAEDGGQHATEIGCIDCHPQHPPKEENIKVPCVTCHDGRPHYQIGDCLHCHANPHKPIESLVDPRKPGKKECLSCHAKVGQRMAARPSRHAELFCTRCHTRHKAKPACLDCHDPHLRNQSASECKKCHSAHQPLKIVPTGYVPAASCRTCHEKEARDLADTPTNHRALNCVYCHKGLHSSIPNCQDCHGLPHGQSIHSKYRRCLDCHGDAHWLVSGR